MQRRVRLQTKVRQVWVIIWTSAQRPAVLPVGFLDRKVVDARDAAAHEAVLVELPILVAIRAEPVAGVVMPLIGEAHRNAILVEGP